MTRKLLLVFGLFWSVVASAQFVPGQVLTAAELNSQFALYALQTGTIFTGPISGTSANFSGLMSVAGLTATGTISLPTASLPLPYLATQTSNTLLANATGSSASPTAISAPSCSTSSSALQWTSGTGLACNTAIAAATSATSTTATNATQLGGIAAASYLTSATAATTYATIAQATTALAATGGSVNGVSVGATTPSTVAATSLSSTGNFTPSQTNGIVGTTTNNNANAGSVGEYVSAITGSTVPLTTTTAANVISISLTAGDWDVSGTIQFLPAGTTAVGTFASSISTTTATRGAYQNETLLIFTAGVGSPQQIPTPIVRVSVASTTTVYLIAYAGFTTSTMTANGQIRARRVR